MTTTPPDAIKGIVKEIVLCLVTGRYDEVEQVTQANRLKSDDMARAIREYGRELTIPPDSAFDDLDAVHVRAAGPARWSIRFDLWTLEEGRSDLTLELTLIEGDRKIEIELDDIHVL